MNPHTHLDIKHHKYLVIYLRYEIMCLHHISVFHFLRQLRCFGCHGYSEANEELVMFANHTYWQYYCGLHEEMADDPWSVA